MPKFILLSFYFTLPPSNLDLTDMLDSHAINMHYNSATRSFCHGGLFGLSLMMIATIATAFLLTILVCVDSHTWIYLTKK